MLPALAARTRHAGVAARESRVPPAPPVFAAGAVRGVMEAAGRLGHDVPSLLAEVGLSPAALQDPDGVISCATVGQLIGAACRRRPIPDFSLRLAEVTPLGAYPLLDYLIVTSGTVGEGLRRFARHSVLVGAPLRIDIE